MENSWIETLNLIGKATMQLLEKFNDNIEDIIKFIDVLENRLPDEFVTLTSRLMDLGWYTVLSVEINKTMEMISNQEDIETINHIMSDYVRNNYERIFDKSCLFFENRAEHLRQCRSAHDNELYSLSIVGLLSQVDGIANDLFGNSFFTKDRSKQYREMSLNDKYHSLIEATEGVERKKAMALLRPLKEVTSIAFSGKTRTHVRDSNSDVCPLNRHEILHGESINYNTEVNSLRCILLLEYFCDLKENFEL